MSSIFETWGDAVQLLTPLVSLAVAGYSYWVSSKSERRATQIVRAAAEAELMKELIAASKDSEVLENDAMRHIRELENEAEQLQKLIAEAKLAANRASGRWGEEAKNGG